MLDCILILKAPFVGGMTGIIIDYLNKWLNFLLFLYFLNNSIFSAIILDVCNTLNCIDSKICIHCFYWNIYNLQNLKIMVIHSQAITCTCTNPQSPSIKTCKWVSLQKTTLQRRQWSPLLFPGTRWLETYLKVANQIRLPTRHKLKQKQASPPYSPSQISNANISGFSSEIPLNQSS